MQQGAVKIGGVDIREIPHADLMKMVAFVFQDPKLFKDTLLENIRAGRPSATRDEVLQAARLAQCDDILEKFPDGLDTVVGSISHAVSVLRDGGFLTMDSDYFLHLTDVGREVAEHIYEKHRFFTDRLIEAGVDPVAAEKDACRMEHVISQESFEHPKNAYKTKE